MTIVAGWTGRRPGRGGLDQALKTGLKYGDLLLGCFFGNYVGKDVRPD